MQVRDELVDAGVGIDERSRHFLRVRRREADALDAGNLGDVLDQRREIRDLVTHLRCRAHRAAIRVDVLPQQRDLDDPLIGEIGDFGQHVVERPRDLLAARVRHHAERAVLAAAFHDRHEGGCAVDRRRRELVELLDGGEGDVDLRAAGRAAVADHLRKAMQRLRPEHDVDVGRARYDGRALLARHAAARRR